MSELPLLYLAGASREHERVCAIAAELERAAPHVRIAFRWFDTAHEWSGHDDELTPHGARELARTAEHAIRQAHIFWLLWPRELSAGAFIECGYARAQRFHALRSYALFVSGAGCETSIFTADVDFRTRIDALALEQVVELVRKRVVPELVTRRVSR